MEGNQQRIYSQRNSLLQLVRCSALCYQPFQINLKQLVISHWQPARRGKAVPFKFLLNRSQDCQYIAVEIYSLSDLFSKVSQPLYVGYTWKTHGYTFLELRPFQPSNYEARLGRRRCVQCPGSGSRRWACPARRWRRIVWFPVAYQHDCFGMF